MTPPTRSSGWLAAAAIVLVAFISLSAPVAALGSSSLSILPWSAPGPSTEALGAISCSDPGRCVALSVHDRLPAVVTLTGEAATTTVLPLPAGETSARLRAIACPSPTSCVAVGTSALGQAIGRPMVETLEGTTWRAEALNIPAGFGSAALLNDVSCARPDRCTAVGTVVRGRHASALVESLADGKWRSQVLDLPPGRSDARLYGVSCAEVAECTAVGTWADHSDGSDTGLVERLREGRWTATGVAPSKGLSSLFLAAVSCPTAGDCVAAGSGVVKEPPLVIGFDFEAVAVVVHGGRIQVSEPPAPDSTTLTDISCTSDASCVAGGNVEDNSLSESGDYAGSAEVVDRLVGTRWAELRPPTPSATQQSLLTGLSCGASNSCTIVASFDEQGPQLPYSSNGDLVQTLSGARWRLSGLRGAPTAALNAASCPTAASCVGVGQYTDDAGNARAFVETLAGGSWARTPLHGHAASTFSSSLSSISCSDATDCMAVGQFADASASPHALAEVLHGSTWSERDPPTPAHAQLVGVSCTSPTDCVAAGETVDPYGNPQRFFAATYTGVAWSLSWLPYSVIDRYGGITGVSCAGGLCVVVGFADPQLEGPQRLLVASSTGGRWTVRLLNGRSDGELDGVSCVSATDCIAVGTEGLAEPHGFVDLFNGTAWRQTVLPWAGPGNSPVGLNAVSCASATSCVAVGEQWTASGEQSYIATLSGSSWSQSSDAGPADAHSQLSGVGCDLAGSCEGVGWAQERSQPLPMAGPIG